MLSQTSLESLDNTQEANGTQKSDGGPDLIAVLANQVVNESNRRRQGGGAKRRIAGKREKKTSKISDWPHKSIHTADM